jgi:hypothetical protein
VKALTFLSEEQKQSPLFQPWPRYRSEEWLSDAELLANNRWVDRIRRILEDRKKEYLPRLMHNETENKLPINRSPTSLVPPELNPNISCHPNSQSAVHRGLRIPEVRELILTLASPDTLLSAWTVCSAWQDTARYVFEVDHQHFYASYPCPPVDCRGDIDPGLQWLIPSAEELAKFDSDLADAQPMVDDMPATRFEMAPPYFSARLTEALKLSEDISTRFKTFDWFQQDYHYNGKALMARNALAEGRDVNPYLPTRAILPLLGISSTHSPQWFDFSQFKLNPYFEAFFGDRISLKNGRFDVALRKSIHMPLYDKNLIPDDILALLGSMHITQPPIKQVSLYT